SQIELKENILEFCRVNIDSEEPAVYFIKGDAGTGKSVVLSSTFNTIQDLSKEKHSDLFDTKNHLLVNHEEMIKTYKSIAESLPNLMNKSIIKTTTFIKNDNTG